MELRHLRYFCAIAEEMHVTRATERLRVAKPVLDARVFPPVKSVSPATVRAAGRRDCVIQRRRNALAVKFGPVALKAEFIQGDFVGLLFRQARSSSGASI